MGAKTSKPITLSCLSNLFKGRFVRIIHGRSYLSNVEGFCKTLHPIKSGGVDIELMDGSRYGFIPDFLDGDAAIGDMPSRTGRRRIEIAPDLERSYCKELQWHSEQLAALLKSPKLLFLLRGQRMALQEELQSMHKLISRIL